ncbi:SMC-Scp complex subunit ScpB [Gammaproteobacteria bacterium]|nr:SMC-Scp complex subunit ScpB [Gammaproteobacteria bacterium]
MDHKHIKNILEAALLGAGKPLTLEVLSSLFDSSSGPDRKTLKDLLKSLASDYEDRGIQLLEVGSGYRIQIRSSMSNSLIPLWEERPPRYSRALLETLALIAYRQPITRGEIEQVRGVTVSTNIVRTLLERGWVRIIGHRDVPGKPALLGTTKEFLDYFSLKRLEDLPPLSDIKDFKGLNIELDFPEPTQQQSEPIESKFNTHSSIENNENIGEEVSVNLENTNSTS